MENLKEITSRDNPLVKHIAKLISSASYRKECGEFVAEGLRICSDCFENSVEVKTLVVTKEFAEKGLSQLEKYLSGIKEKVVVSASVFDKISDTKNPQGILLVGKIPQKRGDSIDKNGRYVALENINDPANLGAVSRTAEALGINGIILSGDGCDPYSPKALRASMGTLLRMPVIVFDNFADELKNSGLKIFCCVVRNGIDIKTADFSSGSAVLIGNEANGLTEEAQKIGTPVTIKMSGTAESLNASVAAAIAMWELIR
ncbi:MAG: RNA methyltransferase [Clostridiales bacterium]|nr:RNA methyltransferase [Candidatus Equinaster intestinalis]